MSVVIVLYDWLWLKWGWKWKIDHIDINRPRPRHRRKCTKFKMCHSTMIVIRIKEHLSNIWGSVHEKVKQHWGCIENKACILEILQEYLQLLLCSQYFYKKDWNDTFRGRPFFKIANKRSVLV